MKWKNLAYSTTFFITATITDWQPLLARPVASDILLSDLEFYRNKYGCKILAYVIMPEHYHIIIEFQQPNDLRGWLHDLQMHTSNEIAKWLKQVADPQALSVYTKHANGNTKLAIWNEQARAVGIVSESVLRTKIEYIHKNPVTRKLVDEPSQWLWSSWRNYCLDDESVFRIDRVEIL
ncbi:MAG: transposase [Armatimonadota bacterium]|nr:transposase [bacterium]